MKIFSKSVVSALSGFVLAALIIGCGGGGGGGGASTSGGGGIGGSTTSGTPAAGQFIEFLTLTGTKLDPLNLLVGQNLKVQFVNYDTFGNRTALPGSFSISGASASSYSVTSTGSMTVLTTPSGLATVSGTAVVSGVSKTLTQDVKTIPTGTKGVVTGRLMSSNGTTAVGNVQVEFYDAQGNFKGGALSGPDGRFSANVSTTMKSMTLKGSTIPSVYYKQMKYLGKDYPVVGLSCPLVLPALGSGQTFALPANITLPRQLDGPPPPPSGCN